MDRLSLVFRPYAGVDATVLLFNWLNKQVSHYMWFMWISLDTDLTKKHKIMLFTLHPHLEIYIKKSRVVWDVTYLLDCRGTLQCDGISCFATFLPNREWREKCLYFAAKQQRLIRADDDSRDLVIFHNIAVQIWNRVVSQCHIAQIF